MKTEKLTLHYQRPFDEKTPWPYKSYEGEKEIESACFHQAIADFETWETFASGFDEIVSFRSLVAQTEPHIEKRSE
jgi:hypothetical protein